MGTEVQCKSSLPGFYPMRELNDDSNTQSWHRFYGETAFTNAQYHNVVLPRATANGYLGDDHKDVVKQKMLEHEAIFKNQVFELHRLYRRQRDLMDKINSSELSRNQLLVVDSLLSSSPLTSQVRSEDASRQNLPLLPVVNSPGAKFSILGVEEGHSSMISVKGNSQKACFFTPPRGSSTKDLQVLESRLTKFRRRMLDLQLPADEYIDSEDEKQFPDGNEPDTLSHNHQKDQRIDLERNAKLYADGCLQNARKSGARLEKNMSCLTDLNEPIPQVETNTSTNIDSLGSASCHGETQFLNPSSRPKSGSINLLRTSSLNTDNGSDNVTGNILNCDKNTSTGGTLPQFLESGHSYTYKDFFSEGLQTKLWPVSSRPMERFICELHKTPVFHSTEKGRVEQSRDGSVSGLQFTKRSHEIKGEPQSSSFASHTSTLHPSVPYFSKSWSNFNSSWESASANFQKLTTAQAQECLNLDTTMHNNFHSLFHGKESSGERWLLSKDSELTKSFDSNISYYNRAFIGSAAEYNEEVGHPSSVSCNYWKPSTGSDRAPKDLSPSMSLKLFKDSNSMHMKCAKEINFNMGFSNSSSNQAERKVEENCTLLPWLRGTTETINSGRFSSVEELIYVRSSIDSLPDKNYNSFQNDVFNKGFESDRSSKSLKLLTLSVSERLQDSKIKESREERLFDINLPCDSLVAESDDRHSHELNKTKISSFGPIDLNLSLVDDEESLRSTVRAQKVIDLEAPAIDETEDIVPIETRYELASKRQCKSTNQQAKLMELAAEAIVSISSSVCHSHLEGATCSPKQDSMYNPLNRLVEMALICSNDYERESQASLRAKPSSDEMESSLDGMDSFESMTLYLTETNAKEYMPMSLIPGSITMEQIATNLLQNRPRKGQARRGRQRRDFQREILPGLTSLSRQEVTEDLNTFGGLIRAMGNEWNLGLTKRNSSRNTVCGRGRRRSEISPSPQPAENLPLLPQPTNSEVGLDNRSLTGWGKTTRRPRRQRVAASHLATIALV